MERARPAIVLGGASHSHAAKPDPVACPTTRATGNPKIDRYRAAIHPQASNIFSGVRCSSCFCGAPEIVIDRSRRPSRKVSLDRKSADGVSYSNGLSLIVQLSPITRAALVTLLALALAHVAAAQEAALNARKYELYIGRQPLTQALQALSKQTGVQHGYLPTDEAEESVLVGPIDGRHTMEEALRKLLPPGFRYEWINGRTISVITPTIDDAPAPEQRHGHEDDPDRFVQDEISKARRIEKVLDRVLVIDSRLGEFDLEAPFATVVLDRPAIESLGVSTVTDAVSYVSQLPYTRPEFSVSGDQRAELRGLGRDTTLLLINGRRAGGSSAAIDISAFDLNTIPLPAVERIEVIADAVPFGAGADAIGGMINIVLRDDVSPPRIDVNYGFAEGGAAERRASVSAGEARERWRVSTVMDYFERDELTGAERDRWRNQDYRRYGGTDWRSNASNPGNVSSLTPNPLPGLPSRVAAVPPHTAGTQLAVEDFLATAGQQNLESLRRYRTIVPERRRISAVLSGDWRITPTTNAFGEFFYTDGDTVVHELPATLSNVVVPAGNPWNPFGEPVAVSFLPSIGPRLWTTDATFLRMLAGAEGQLGDWRWELSVLRTHDSMHLVAERNLDPAGIADALAQTEQWQALNPFDDGPGGDAGLISGLIAAPTKLDNSARETEWRAQLSGHPVRLPGGPISALFGVVRRESSVATTLPAFHGSPYRSADSAFIELSMPFIDAAMRVPGIVDLSLTASGRIDAFSDLGTQSHSQWVFAWHPIKSLAFRGTYATAYRAPSLYEMHLQAVTMPVSALDLRRANEVTTFMATAGGNPQLVPATARNWSAGVAWESKTPHLLQATATYWHSDSIDQINPIPLRLLLANEELFPGRVVRAAPTESDRAAGFPGTLTAINTTFGNFGRIQASGLDASLSFSLHTLLGRFKPTISATWMDEFMVVDLPGTASVDRLALASLVGTIPRWRGSAALAWSRNGMSATTVLRHVSAYDDFSFLLDRRNGRVVPAQTLLDVQVQWSLAQQASTDSIWKGFSLTVGATNVLDKKPAYAEVGIDAGYDYTQGDLKGRFAYVRLSKRF